MKRSRLTRVVVILFIFYGAASLIYFIFMPSETLAAMNNVLPDFMRVAPPPATTGLADMGAWERLLVINWTLPLTLGWLVSLAVGALVAQVGLLVARSRFQKRGQGGQGWAGAHNTIGHLLAPRLPHEIENLSVATPGVSLTPEQAAFVSEAVGLLAARPDTFAGDGHGKGLYQHTLNVMERAASHPDVSPVLVMAAAAHDLGKLTSYARIGSSWQKVRDHGIESGRLLRLLPAFDRLDEADATAVFLAVRYEHCPDQMPRDTPTATHDLLRRLSEVDGLATADEKKAVLGRRDPAAELLDAFDANLPKMPFYRKGLARKATTVGQRKGRRLYMYESGTREWLTYRLDRDFAAALGGRIRPKGKVHAITQHLLRQLYERGWLVTTIDTDEGPVTLPPEVALWTVQFGAKAFNGVFILNIPEDAPIVLPEAAPYAITPLGPTLSSQATWGDQEPDDAAPEDSEKPHGAPSGGQPKGEGAKEPKAAKGRTARKRKRPSKGANKGAWSGIELAMLEQGTGLATEAHVARVASRLGRSEEDVAAKLVELQALPPPEPIPQQSPDLPDSPEKSGSPDPNPPEKSGDKVEPLPDPGGISGDEPGSRPDSGNKSGRSDPNLPEKSGERAEPLPDSGDDSGEASGSDPISEAAAPDQSPQASGPWSDDEVALIEQHLSDGKVACIRAVAKATGRSERSVERKVKKVRKAVRSRSETPDSNSGDCDHGAYVSEAAD